MKRKVIVAFVLIALFLFSVVPRGHALSGTVSGVVTGSDGVNPVVGASVEALQTGDTVVMNTVTGADGGYSLSVPIGSYKLRVSAENRITKIEPVVNVTGGTTTTVNFRLTVGRMLVYDEFMGTNVNASLWDWTLGGWGSVGNATSEPTQFSNVGLSSLGDGGFIKCKVAAALDSTIMFEARVAAYVEAGGYGVYGDGQPRGLRAGTDENNAIEFRSVSGSTYTIEARTVASGVATTTDYIAGSDLGRWNWIYRIEANSSAVKFYVNSDLIATHTTNIPIQPLNIYMGTSAPGVGNVPVSADYLCMTEVLPNRTWIVDDDGTADFHKIQEAIDAASDGDTISVRSGIYYEEVVVDKSVWLVGEDRETTIVYGNGTQYALSIRAEHVSLASFAVTNATAGIRIETSNCTVSNVKVFGTYVGIWAYESANCVISESLIASQTVHHVIEEDFGGWGILLESSWLYDIDRNIFENIEDAGIAIWRCAYVLVKNNTFNGTSIGISLEALSCTVAQNHIENNLFGIYLSSSSDNAVSGNSLTHNGDGIYLDSSSNNSVSGNNVANNDYGIWLDSSSNYNSVGGNTITNNTYNGIGFYDFSNYNSVSESNIANNGGYGIYLYSSLGNNVSGNTIENNYDGIFLSSSSDNSISGNSIADNYDGICLSSSSNNSVSENSITANDHDGIWLTYSSNNSIGGNNITANKFGGTTLYSSSSNGVNGNNIENNYGGIYAYSSSNNSVCHNNFVNNTQQVYSADSPNVWDDGYPSGGNYWSDYTGVDLDHDGIGDIAYVIDANNKDMYPLMHLYVRVTGDINDDRIVDIYDAILLGTCFNSTPDDPNWNSNADFNDDSLIDIYDAIVLASNFGKTA